MRLEATRRLRVKDNLAYSFVFAFFNLNLLMTFFITVYYNNKTAQINTQTSGTHTHTELKPLITCESVASENTSVIDYFLIGLSSILIKYDMEKQLAASRRPVGVNVVKLWGNTSMTGVGG